jgi:hypothetical protein
VHHVGRFAELEDQLCAFTTQGYRGEGSPDRADALVWALTELMLGQSEGWGIFEHYRRQAEARGAEAKADVDVAAAPAVPSRETIKLKAPPGTSTVHAFGRAYVVGTDGLVEVAPDEAGPLRGHGFESMEGVAGTAADVCEETTANSSGKLS